MASTYSKASIGNGLLAIIAGFVSQVSSDAVGDIGPFQLAIAMTVLALVIVARWPENYGSVHSAESTNFSLKELSPIFTEPKIFFVGLGYSFFEGAMYTFGKSASLLALHARVHL